MGSQGHHPFASSSFSFDANGKETGPLWILPIYSALPQSPSIHTSCWGWGRVGSGGDPSPSPSAASRLSPEVSCRGIQIVCEADLGLLPGKAPGQVLPVALGHFSSTLTFSSLQTATYGACSLSLFSPFFFTEHLQALSVSLCPSTLLQIVHSPGADPWWWPPSPQARRPGHPYSPERPLPSQPGS